MFICHCHAPLVHLTRAPLGPQGLPYWHWVPSGALHLLPSFGTVLGQPAVVGGAAHCQWGGGGPHGPALHELHRHSVPSA